MKNIITSEICKKCDGCCKKYPFVELSQKEIDGIEKLTKLSSACFTYPKDAAGNTHFLQFNANGDCVFLNKNNGGYACGIYEARPALCKNYPSNPKQNKACEAKRAINLINNSG